MNNVNGVRFVDIPAMYKSETFEIKELFSNILENANFVGGPIVEKFEQSLADYVGVKHAVGCSDGTMALVLALKAAGVRDSDCVAVPANSFIASANAVP